MGLIRILFSCRAGEFVRLADLPCLADLVFVGNPLEEKHSAEGTWMDEACKRLPNLKKLDGESEGGHPLLSVSALALPFSITVIF